MENSLDEPWWNLDQALIWVATRDRQRAAHPDANWLMDVMAFANEDRDVEHLTSEERSIAPLNPIAKIDLVRALSAGKLSIKVGLTVVPLEWFDGCEVNYKRDNTACLSRWRYNLSIRPEERIYPDQISPRFLAAEMVEIFPGAAVDSNACGGAQALRESIKTVSSGGRQHRGAPAIDDREPLLLMRSLVEAGVSENAAAASVVASNKVLGASDEAKSARLRVKFRQLRKDGRLASLGT